LAHVHSSQGQGEGRQSNLTTTEIVEISVLLTTTFVEEQFQIDNEVALRDMAFDIGLSCGTVQH
jgi:hypothetical protein